ncbi:hypothetical protein GCM10010449_38840 [Streptomyces rectiviolaceus]|uniref:Uncharacterized protein n=1 Tax=Streptomyces rectiviolaceus TaxID=332591 RepID=A0ABP6MGL7_9ACTN
MNVVASWSRLRRTWLERRRKARASPRQPPRQGEPTAHDRVDEQYVRLFRVVAEGNGRPLDAVRPLLEVGFPARFHQPGADGADLVLAGGVGPLC